MTKKLAEKLAEWSADRDLAILLSDHAAAALLGISRATLWRRVNDGTLPRPVKLGGVTRWRRAELLLAVERAVAERDSA